MIEIKWIHPNIDILNLEGTLSKGFEFIPWYKNIPLGTIVSPFKSFFKKKNVITISTQYMVHKTHTSLLRVIGLLSIGKVDHVTIVIPDKMPLYNRENAIWYIFHIESGSLEPISREKLVSQEFVSEQVLISKDYIYIDNSIITGLI